MDDLPIILIYLAVAVLTVAIGWSFDQRRKHGNHVKYDRVENVGVGIASVLMLAAVTISVV
jgi:hypothetical protein